MSNDHSFGCHGNIDIDHVSYLCKHRKVGTSSDVALALNQHLQRGVLLRTCTLLSEAMGKASRHWWL